MLAKYTYRYKCIAHFKTCCFHSVLGFWGRPSISITSGFPGPGLLTEVGQSMAVLPILSLASRCPYIVMLSSVISRVLLNLSFFHDFLLSDLRFCLLYQLYPNQYLRGDRVMLWHKAQSVNGRCLRMKSICLLYYVSTFL